MSQSTLIESLFTLVFAPSCPFIVDPTGHLQSFLTRDILSELQIRELYASDTGINSRIEQIMRSNGLFGVLNDLNDGSQESWGKSQFEEPLLNRLAHITHNGYEFDYDRLYKLKSLHTLNAFHNTFSSVNKRIPVASQPEFENLSFYQIQIFSPRFEFTLPKSYLSRATMLVAMDSDAELMKADTNCSNSAGLNAAWIEVKEMMLKHFLPE